MGVNTNADKQSDNDVVARAALNRLAALPIGKSGIYALKVAMGAIAEEVGGTLTIRIPTKPGAPLEVEFSSKSYT